MSELTMAKTVVDLDLAHTVAITVVAIFAIFGATFYATVRFLVRHR